MPHVMEVGHCEEESSNFISFEGDVVLEWCLLAWYFGDEWGAIKVEESFTLYYFNDVPITLFYVEKSND